MPRVARQRVDKQVEQFGLRGDIEFGVGMLTMEFYGLSGNAELLSHESSAVPKEHQFDDLLLTAGQD